MRMPADWELHKRSWIALPNNPELWQKRYYTARQTVLDFANRVIDFEPVNLICPQGYGNFLTSYTDKRIEIVEAETGENWLSDISPKYLETDKGKVKAIFSRACLNLPNYKTIRKLLCDKVNITSTILPITIENGAMTSDGQGTVICTRNGVFSSRRNDTNEYEKIEQIFKRYLGQEKIIWLNRSLAIDQNQGHITNLVRFIRPGIVLLANHGNSKDPNKIASIDCYDQLTEQSDNYHEKLSVYQVHNPPPITYKGQQLSTSYTNFYIANNAVFIPSFYKPKYDKRAYNLFKALFPHHEIIQQPVLPLLTGGGGFSNPVCPQIAGRHEMQQIHDRVNQPETSEKLNK